MYRKMMIVALVSALIAFSGIEQVHGNPTGPPTSVCSGLVPGHPTPASEGFPGGFYIISDLVDNGGNYTAGQNYTIELRSVTAEVFRGFVIQVREAGGPSTAIGTFMPPGAGSRFLACADNPTGTVTHSNNDPKTSVQFVWTAPMASNGTADIRYSVVVSFGDPFFADMSAAMFRPPPPGCPVQRHDITEFPFSVGIPDGCMREQCEYYVALGPNLLDSNSLEIYLEGNALGWVALGFSDNLMMAETDVLGCNVNNGSIVNVVDTWNPLPNPSPNEPDVTNSSLCIYETMFDGVRISCQFSRMVMAQNATEDFDLNQPYWLVYGNRPEEQNSTDSLEFHGASNIPTFSPGRINPIMPVPPEVQRPCPSPPDDDAVYTFTEGSPTGPFYFAARVNDEDPNYIDMILDAEAVGWVAVGFSDSQNMDAADVLGCTATSDSNVLVRDSWNTDPSTGVLRANTFDPDPEAGVCTYSTSLAEGRIFCSFSRLIAAIPEDVTPQRDLNLNESWFQMYGTGSQIGSSSFPRHESTPSLGPRRVSLLTDTGSSVPPSQQRPCPSPPDDNAVYTFTEGSPTDPFYFAARVNDEDPNYVDMILDAEAVGWVAVGFSDSRNMDAADVLGCTATSDSNVLVRDSWNTDPSTGVGRANTFDFNPEAGVCTYRTSLAEGRIFCSFSRLIAAIPEDVDPRRDLNLNESLFQMYGTGSQIGSTSFPRHESTPSLTTDQVSLLTDTGSSIFPQCELTQTHGIFMVVAWPILVTFAIFLAAWMKPALPNGEWFQVHRVFMIISLLVTGAGFIFIFVANLGLITFDQNPTGTAHFVIGIIVFALQIANPIIAAFRCAPSGSNRWIFNLSHGTVIGLTAELLALTNVGIGIALFENGSGCSNLGGGSFRIFWVYIAYIVFVLLVQFIMFIIFAIVAANAELPERRKLAPSFIKYFYPAPPPKNPDGIEMSSPDKEKSKEPAPPARKPPSDDAYLRWVGFGVYLSVTFILMLVIVIMIAVLPSN